MVADATKRKVDISHCRKQFYEAVRKIAHPGDLCFFICDGTNPLNYSYGWSLLRRVLRRWRGFADVDNTLWHVGIISKFKKQKSHSQIRPYIIHSIKEVKEQHISPKWIFAESDATGKPQKRILMAILRFAGINSEKCEDLVAFCRNRIGKPFPKLFRAEDLTYTLGLPNFLRKPDEYACHWLIYDAFESIGLSFPHQVATFPLFNIARHLGHPLGHSKDKVNPRFPYLRDHHLYRDARFQCLLLVYVDLPTGDMHISENPGKYSWNPKLAATYNIEDVSNTIS